jgi:hypothetical protein
MVVYLDGLKVALTDGYSAASMAALMAALMVALMAILLAGWLVVY